MHTDNNRPAVAYIKGGASAPLLCGKVEFHQKKGWVMVIACVSGLPRTNCFYGFHVHEGADCGGDAFADTGGHYNPDGMPHPQHAGDLPPLMACGDAAYLAVATSRFTVRDIIGKTVVIHSDADDFRTQPAGNAGEKIACGTICRGKKESGAQDEVLRIVLFVHRCFVLSPKPIYGDGDGSEIEDLAQNTAQCAEPQMGIERKP